eukprot:Platyproteum_vivax@DN13701_c0_g1_i1.p1
MTDANKLGNVITVDGRPVHTQEDLDAILQTSHVLAACKTSWWRAPTCYKQLSFVPPKSSLTTTTPDNQISIGLDDKSARLVDNQAFASVRFFALSMLFVGLSALFMGSRHRRGK